MSRLVFCEDEVQIQKLIRIAMRTTAHEIHIAVDGRDGLALIERIRPDAVFTDVSMPNLNGFELADAMHARPELAGIPVIFITASVQRMEQEDAFSHGAAAVIPKPFGAAELRQKVDAILSGLVTDRPGSA